MGSMDDKVAMTGDGQPAVAVPGPVPDPDRSGSAAPIPAEEIPAEAVADEPENVAGRKSPLRRCIGNLIDNAMRHAPGAGPVHVSLSRNGVLAQIVVEDAGPGLPEDLIERLERGQSLRDPPLQRKSGGIGGLGLAIAQRVADLHGGSLRPLPAGNGGTRLCLALPLSL